MNKLSADDRKKVEARTRELLQEEMVLQEIRRVCQYSQETMAQLLNVQQAEVSKMERRLDMYVSTLRRYIESMGGTLERVARFPECGAVRIRHLSLPCIEGLEDCKLDRLR